MKGLRILAGAMCFALAVPAFTACADKTYDYYDVKIVTFEDGTVTEQFVQVNFSPEKEYEVWVKISDLKTDDSVVNVAAGYSSTVNSKKSTVHVTNDMLTATDGWVRLITNVSTSYAYVDVYTKYEMRIHEIVICGKEDAKVYTSTLYKSGYRVSQTSSSNRHEYTEEELQEMKAGPDKTVDAQPETFDRDAIGAKFAPYEPSTSQST